MSAPKTKIIQGVSTSTAAFIGTSEKGPLRTAVRITNVREFRSHFGSYSPRMEVGYAVHQFFQNGGRDAWFVRVERRAGDADLVGNRRKRRGSMRSKISIPLTSSVFQRSLPYPKA